MENMVADDRVEDLFNDSYDRVIGLRVSDEGRDRFLDDFYARFIASSELIRKKFENTDMQRQRRMLHQSLVYLVNYYANQNVNDFLQRIAERHSRRDLDIAPELYDLWLEKLIEAVAEADRQFKPEVGDAWKQILAPGIRYMREQY